jgi:DNA repair protein RadD
VSALDGLRPYQIDALENLRDGIRNGFRRQVLQLPTGSGKTRVAAAITELVRSKGKRVLFLADRIELIDQASMRFDAEGIDHGIIQGQHFRWHPELPVQIGTIQTLLNREAMKFDLIVVDECHAGGKRLNDWITKQDAVVIGLSATPWAKGLGKIYQRLIVGTRVRELIEMGFLVDVEAYAPSTPDLSGVKVVAGEWVESELAKAVDTPRLVGDIVTTWIQYGEGRQTIVFGVDVAHSKHIVEQFRAAGVDAAHVDGYENAEARRDTIRRFRNGQLRLISNVGILDKGFDVPEASCIVMARPIRSSLMLHIQQIGRVMRPAPGKTNAIILDHAGNLLRHGFPTDELPEELDDGKKKAKAEAKPQEKQPKLCPKCKAVKRPGVHVCPKCGFAPERQNEVFHEAGELAKVERKPKLSTIDKADLYAQIKFVQEERGRKDGWAAHKFREITGVWPNHYRDVEPKPASTEVRNKLRSLDIAFAKAKGRPGPGWRPPSDARRDRSQNLVDALNGGAWKEDAINA